METARVSGKGGGDKAARSVCWREERREGFETCDRSEPELNLIIITLLFTVERRVVLFLRFKGC